MRLTRIRILALFFFLFVLFACGGSNEVCAGFPAAPYASFRAEGRPLAIELRTAPNQPPERGSICAELRVADADGAPRDDLAIDVVPWMPAHGHGSNVVPVVTARGEGVYRIESLDLSMPGTWELCFAFKAPDLDAHATTTLDVR